MPEIVFDTCVISNFALAGALGIMENLYRDRAHITDFVAAEILRGIRAGHARLEAIPKAVRSGWLQEIGLRTGKERGLFETLLVSLGLGEASSIAVAKRRGFRFASDDRVARTEAARLGVPLTGTLGILVKAARGGICDLRTADAHLGKMIEAGFFSPVRSIGEWLNGNL
jgi:predicted nucleic acid-binding protein